MILMKFPMIVPLHIVSFYFFLYIVSSYFFFPKSPTNEGSSLAIWSMMLIPLIPPAGSPFGGAKQEQSSQPQKYLAFLNKENRNS